MNIVFIKEPTETNNGLEISNVEMRINKGESKTREEIEKEFARFLDAIGFKDI